jgi:hypothetical protein
MKTPRHSTPLRVDKRGTVGFLKRIDQPFPLLCFERSDPLELRCRDLRPKALFIKQLVMLEAIDLEAVVERIHVTVSACHTVQTSDRDYTEVPRSIVLFARVVGQLAASTVETSLSRARFALTLDPYGFSNSASNGIDLRIFEAVAQDRADPNPSIQILLGRIYKLAKIDFDQLGRFVQLRVFEWRRCVRASEESCSE